MNTEPCAICQLGKATEVEREVFTFKGSFHVKEFQCDTCKDAYVDDKQARENEAKESSARQ